MANQKIIKDQTTTTRWFSKTVDIKTVLTLVGGLLSFIIACSFFYWKSQAAWEKQRDDKTELLLKINTLEEKVNRQYITAREEREKLLQGQNADREREFNAIEEVADWMHEQIGYQKGLQRK